VSWMDYERYTRHFKILWKKTGNFEAYLKYFLSIKQCLDSWEFYNEVVEENSGMQQFQRWLIFQHEDFMADVTDIELLAKHSNLW
jgi:hypothetical protein